MTINKELTIKRLQRLYDFMQTRKPEQFDFSRLVTEYDKKNHCGTICCALGWLPHVFPGDYSYMEHPLNYSGYTLRSQYSETRFFFGISGALIDHLFEPMQQYPRYYGGKTLNRNANLSDFLSNFQIVLTRLKAGELDFALSRIAEPETSEV